MAGPGRAALRHYRLIAHRPVADRASGICSDALKGRRVVPDGPPNMVSGRSAPARETLKSLAFHPPNEQNRPPC